MTDTITQSCCQRPAAEPLHKQSELSRKMSDFFQRIQPAVDIICRIALGVFAAMTNPVAFTLAAGTGALIGAAITLYKNIQKETFENGDLISTCATGFWEQLSGKRYPKVVLTVVTAVFISMHFNHPSFIGFCMVPWGIFVGSSLTQAVWNLGYREIYRLDAPPINNVSDIFAPMPAR